MFRKILSLILGILLISAIATGVTKLVKSKTEMKTTYPTYVIGGLDANGNFTDVKDRLVTESIIQYDKIEITLDFNCFTKYQLFFYDHEGNFLNSSGVLNEKYEEESETTKYVRIVIIPRIDAEDNNEIKFYQKHKYSFDVNVKVYAKEIATLCFVATFTRGSYLKYYYQEGMTWDDFINSSYNIDNVFSMTSAGIITFTFSDGSKSSVGEDNGQFTCKNSNPIPKNVLING